MLLVTLMYGFGARIGELLGLTLEDLYSVTIDGVRCYYLALRNRMSDRRYQHAKNKPHVSDKSQYYLNYYINSTGKLFITEDMFNKLSDFISHCAISNSLNENSKYNETVADIVNPKGKMKENHYVFVNPDGSLLKITKWNSNLRKYYEEAGIDVDFKIRINNLNHRLRHGFAMFYVKEGNIDPIALQKLMRHKSFTSTNTYFNPTLKDQSEIIEEYGKFFLELLENKDERK